MEKENIKQQIEKMAEDNGYLLNKDTLDRIINAKLRFFGSDNWKNCPCANDGKHSCISDTCKDKIEKDGRCHCNLFVKKTRLPKLTPKNEQEPGFCPVCGGCSLDYGDLDGDNDGIWYEFECLDCGAVGKEFYNIEFSHHFDVTDKDGNTLKPSDS